MITPKKDTESEVLMRKLSRTSWRRVMSRYEGVSAGEILLIDYSKNFLGDKSESLHELSRK